MLLEQNFALFWSVTIDLAYLGLNCSGPKCPSTLMPCSVYVFCISQGQFVSEYVGDLIDEQEARRRLTEAYRNNVSNFYMMTLDSAR